MMIEALPDVFQQSIIALTLLYLAYRIGLKKTKNEKGKSFAPDPFFALIVKYLLIVTAVIYIEAVLQYEIAKNEQSQPQETLDDDAKTREWLKKHSDLFWFILSCRQSIIMAILGYEFFGENRVKQFYYFGLFPPLIQWHVGLFSPEPMGGAIAGLLFEFLTVLLLLTYTAKICTTEAKFRALIGFFANFSYIISALPVLFLALQMRGPHEMLYLTILFGCFSFAAWARLMIMTNSSALNKRIFLPTEDPKTSKKDEEIEIIPSFTIDEK
jgi:hypothetical protein